MGPQCGRAEIEPAISTSTTHVSLARLPQGGVGERGAASGRAAEDHHAATGPNRGVHSARGRAFLPSQRSPAVFDGIVLAAIVEVRRRIAAALVAPSLRAAAAEERIWVHMPAPGFGPHFDDWFDAALSQRTKGKREPFAVRRSADGELIGSTSYLDPVPIHKRVEIGATWYRPETWASAVNPECKLLLMTHAFESLGLNRVSLVKDLRNARSQAAIAKLGAVREGVLRSHMIVFGGRVRDSVFFAVTSADWPEVKRKLLARLAEMGY